MSQPVEHRIRARLRGKLGPAGLALLVVALTAGLASGSAGARAAKPDPQASLFFGISRIQAVALPGRAATSYSVEVTNAPVGNTPYARWYLDLKPSATGRIDCTNALLPGGTRIGSTRYGWRNQGTTFVWFHGAQSSYPADRGYGCDQADLGRNGYPGSVRVVFENDSQHCTATFRGIALGSEPAYGPNPVCALGGYLPLPVPRTLLQTYAKVDRELAALSQKVRLGQLSGGTATLAQTIDAILKPQAKAFARLFPPVWGCDFDTVFNPLLQVKSLLSTQIPIAAEGKQVSGSSLTDDIASMRAAASSVRACEPSANRPLGTPPAVVSALDRLAAETASLPAGASSPSSLATKLQSIEAALDAVLQHGFPTVFGIPYIGLLDRVLVENGAVLAAQRAAGTRDPDTVASALAVAANHEGTIAQALRKQAKRAATAEKAA